MKVDLVLTAATNDSHYGALYPLTRRVWKERFGLELHMILVSATLPDALIPYKDSITLFRPPTTVSPIYASQVVRLLYPALFPGKTVLITDADIIPISRSYFIDSIADHPEDAFVTWRDKYIRQQMYGMCYNAARADVWGAVFGIKSLEDIRIRLTEWYNPGYTGTKNCTGWFTDQQQLYQCANRWSGGSDKPLPDKAISGSGKPLPDAVPNRTRPLIVMQDKVLGFRRLDKRERKKILSNVEVIKATITTYTDFHVMSPYNDHKKLYGQIVERLCKDD